MDDNYYFEGDPQVDSARRHMERVLSGSAAPRRRWWWVFGLLAGGSSWALWRTMRRS